ncbi:MAG: DNA polymerase/3'-5' exonuclease PolX [Planctomycetota bacterium]
MVNKEIADIFEEIADLLEIKGEQPFRVNSYRRAARTLNDLTRDVAALAEAGELGSLSGIGKSTIGKIEEYLAEGRVSLHAELLESMPEGLPALLDIQGLGPKRVAQMWRELGVDNIEGLKETIASGKLAELKGMGSKSVAQIAAAIAFAEKSAGRTPLGLAWPLATELAAAMEKVKGVGRVAICGSVRRGCETVGDLDLLCESTNGKAVIEAFTAMPQVRRTLAAGETKASVLVARRDGDEMQADCRVVPQESFGAALQYFTGSKEHNVRLREIASKKGWKLNEWGLFSGSRRLAGKDEVAIYKKLGLPSIPPEVREDRGEFDVEAPLRLVEQADIRGDLHLHTTASDGTADAEAMARAAEERGYDYIAVTDHSRSSTIANGLSIDLMWRQIEKIRKLNKKLDATTVLTGCEVDILSDGSLDYPDQLLAACEFVVASVHVAMRQSRDKVTARVLAAMESPYVTAIGHPTGRLLGRREPMDLDMEAVIAKAAETGTALELNAAWQRLDLNDRHARMARESGVMICLSTDAHSTAQYDQMKYGLATARRAWLRPDDVLNTRPLPALRKWVAKKRG